MWVVTSLQAAKEARGAISVMIEATLSPGPSIYNIRRHGDSSCLQETGFRDDTGNFFAAKEWVGSGEQGFAIGSEERLSRLTGYFSELAAAAFVFRGGVKRVHLLDGTQSRVLLLELFKRDGMATELWIRLCGFFHFFEEKWGEVAVIAVSSDCCVQCQGDKFLGNHIQLSVLLHDLVFDNSFSMDKHQIKRSRTKWLCILLFEFLFLHFILDIFFEENDDINSTLLFESSIFMDVHQIKSTSVLMCFSLCYIYMIVREVWWKWLCFAGFGVLISKFCLLKLAVLEVNYSFRTDLAFGMALFCLGSNLMIRCLRSL
ncbi:unnamed protein product [Arabidopsis arenosa]|uniref:Uncharacterized protein n=1 Tax=Arabidopsis arenosa TaxID=38785 RepID=A0A8S1ZP77_ARAAE|nr:unnamed protein product [Arabidopsis arenosa]